MGAFKLFKSGKSSARENSKRTAMNRLKSVLESDRTKCSQDQAEQMYKD